MQEKESIMAVRCKLKIPSLWITVWHHSASLVMPNSYPRDGIFNPHLTSMKDSYIFYFVCPSSCLSQKAQHNFYIVDQVIKPLMKQTSKQSASDKKHKK